MTFWDSPIHSMEIFSIWSQVGAQIGEHSAEIEDPQPNPTPGNLELWRGLVVWPNCTFQS